MSGGVGGGRGAILCPRPDLSTTPPGSRGALCSRGQDPGLLPGTPFGVVLLILEHGESFGVVLGTGQRS